MPAAHDGDPLLAGLAGLAELAGEQDRAAIAGLRSRLRERRLRVLVAGEAKRGKSTLVNALLGRAVLPAGVTPLTALATTVRYGRRERVTVTFPGGRREGYPLSALNDLVTERGNPGNSRGIASVTVTVGAPLLASGVELVDTPGTGSVYAHNTAEAETALESMDAAVFVLSADPPVSASERDLMGRVAALSVTMFVVLNKADYLAPGAGAAGNRAGFPNGARHRDGQREGAAPGNELAEALEFTARVAAVAGRRRDAADLARAESARMLTDLNGAAGRHRARAYLHRETAHLVPQQIGRARADLQYRLAEATRRLVRVVEARYAGSASRLENALVPAAALRQATEEEAAQRDRELAQRQAALDSVFSLLTEENPSPGRARRGATSSQAR